MGEKTGAGTQTMPQMSHYVSASENTRLLNAHQFMMSAVAAVVSIGPAYARKTIRGNGKWECSNCKATGNGGHKGTGRWIEDAQKKSSWHKLIG